MENYYLQMTRDLKPHTIHLNWVLDLVKGFLLDLGITNNIPIKINFKLDKSFYFICSNVSFEMTHQIRWSNDEFNVSFSYPLNVIINNTFADILWDIFARFIVTIA